jgi:hypothetical protein
MMKAFAYHVHGRIALDLWDREGRVPKEGGGSPLRIYWRYKRGKIDDMLMVYIATTKAQYCYCKKSKYDEGNNNVEFVVEGIFQDVYMNCVYCYSNGEGNEYTN